MGYAVLHPSYNQSHFLKKYYSQHIYYLRNGCMGDPPVALFASPKKPVIIAASLTL
jgi:hypothetical protein